MGPLGFRGLNAESACSGFIGFIGFRVLEFWGFKVIFVGFRVQDSWVVMCTVEAVSPCCLSLGCKSNPAGASNPKP